MNYKILSNARILMAADGSKQLFIDTGTDVVPVNNRLAYSEFGETQLLPKEDITFVPIEDEELPFAVAELPLVDLVEGQEYTVLCGEQSYVCKCIQPYTGMYFLGNLYYVVGDPEFDTGEPFVFLSSPAENMSMMGVLPAVHCCIPVCISTFGEIVHPIDKKYLPEGIGESGGSTPSTPSNPPNLHFIKANTSLDLSQYADGDVLLILN